jgi:hypothetical protein
MFVHHVHVHIAICNQYFLLEYAIHKPALLRQNHTDLTVTEMGREPPWIQLTSLIEGVFNTSGNVCYELRLHKFEVLAKSCRYEGKFRDICNVPLVPAWVMSCQLSRHRNEHR